MELVEFGKIKTQNFKHIICQFIHFSKFSKLIVFSVVHYLTFLPSSICMNWQNFASKAFIQVATNRTVNKASLEKMTTYWTFPIKIFKWNPRGLNLEHISI
jgi:hypothetical protein